MYVAYFDEVKNDNAAGRDHYFVGGIVVPMEQIGTIERKMSAFANELFNSFELVPETEFHADFIYRGKGPFKGMDMGKRAAILGRLANIIVEGDICRKVYAAINVPRIYNPAYAPEYAFAHFVERLQMCVGVAPCVMIGDQDDEQVRNMVKDFARYRARGTPWAHGIMINSVIDTVHFCRSHHSRLVQLADAYLWLCIHRWGFRKSKMADLVNSAIEGCNLFPTNYKIWPNN